jgi:putative transcriptional regulator
MAKTKQDFDLGDELIAAMKEVTAHLRGEVELPSRVVHHMPAKRVKAIRRSVAKSTADFERRFHVPARTIEGWEQGRREPDDAAKVLLTIIEADPQSVEKALTASAAGGKAKRSRQKAVAA